MPVSIAPGFIDNVNIFLDSFSIAIHLDNIFKPALDIQYADQPFTAFIDTPELMFIMYILSAGLFS